MNARTVKSIAVAWSLMGACAATAAQPAGGYSGPVIDAHAHLRLGESDALLPDQPVGTDALQRIDERAGVSESALIVIAPRADMARTRAQNDAVLDSARSSHGRFYAVVSVHPADADDALAELDRVARLGAREVKLHPNTQAFDVADPAVGKVVDRCGELGLVVLFDSYKPWDSSEMGKFMVLAIQHPKAKLVLAHMGYTYFREAVSFDTLRRLGLARNVWFDLSAIATTYAGSPLQPELVWTIRKVGTDRFLFGSDWPVYAPAEAIAAVRLLGFTRREQQQIFHDNVVALLGLNSQ
jgi:predicted TIM-barrel fold metal-dependent hydrolase